MAIAAQRFKFLDRETNLGIKDFTTLTSNAVYTAEEQLTKTALSLTKDNDQVLKKLHGSIVDLEKMVNSTLNDSAGILKTALNSSIDSISNIDTPPTIKKMFNSLKELDLSGVKSFFKQALSLGSAFLCHNLDFLKNFTIGFSINKHILGGLITGLLLSWLDRYCKGYTKEETAKASPISKIGMIIKPTGTEVNSKNIYSLYSAYKSDFLKSKSPIGLSAPASVSSFITSVTSGNVDYSLTNLKNSEISDTLRNSYISAIDTNLGLHLPTSTEYTSLLDARGKLLTSSFINPTRRDNAIAYEHLSDKLGSFSKNMTSVNIEPVSNFSLSTEDQAIYSELFTLKNTASTSMELNTRSHDTGSFDHLDFTTILPESSPTSTNYLLSLNKESDSHKLYDIHPTTEVFMET